MKYSDNAAETSDNDAKTELLFALPVCASTVTCGI